MSQVRFVTQASGLNKWGAGGARGTGIQHSPPRTQ